MSGNSRRRARCRGEAALENYLATKAVTINL
jgi:hypothetical protein